MFRENLRKAPLLRVILPFGAGLLAGSLFRMNIGPTGIIMIIVLVVIALILAYGISSRYQYRWVFGVILIPGLMVFGSLYYHCYHNLVFSQQPQEGGEAFQAKVLEHVKVTPARNIYNALCIAQRKNGIWNPVHVKIQLYVACQKDIDLFKPGDKLIVKSPLKPAEPPMNPGEFNYQRYLEHRGIWGSASAGKAGVIKKIVQKPVLSLESVSYELQDKFLSVFSKLGIEGDEHALLSALTIGVRDHIDNEINQAFSASGAMHILSVSGLHVGIIYLVIARLLSFAGKNRYLKIISAVLQVCFLWFYAFLTGLSPAVNRAAAMFSFLAIGQSMKRSANTMNVLAASALVLLLINPFMIFDIGFQLSYQAVFSIVLFQPFIYGLIDFKNYIADQIWKLIALSVAAQVGTFPLSIYYFHQFPNYFIATNLLVVPLAAVILYLALALVLLFWIPGLSTFLAWILKISLKGMIYSVMTVEHLPYSVLPDIKYSIQQTIWIYILLILLACFIYFRSKRFIFIFFAGFAVLLVSIIIKDIQSDNRESFVVFRSQGSSVILASKGRDAMVLYSGRGERSRLQAVKISNNFCIDLGIRHKDLMDLDSLVPGKLYSTASFLSLCIPKRNIAFIQSGTNIFLWVKGNNIHIPIPAKQLPVNALILGNKGRLPQEDIIKVFPTRQIVFDSSCGRQYVDSCMISFARYNAILYDVSSRGAFFIMNR